VGTSHDAPGPQQKRLAAYLDGLAQAAGHADRHAPLKNYCTGLLLPGERKSVEPMAARLAPDNVRRMHQSLHHLVADAPWNDAALLARVREQVLPAMETQGSVVAWVVDDTGFPKKGTHSVGVARQYCGEVGNQENCRVAVSLSVATWSASLPIAYQLYLPEAWAKNRKRRQQARIPDEIPFRTKPPIALEQIRQAVETDVRRGIVLADAGYGIDGQFRAGLTALELPYVVGVQSSTTVWAPGTSPLPAKPWSGQGRPPRLLRRDNRHLFRLSVKWRRGVLRKRIFRPSGGDFQGIRVYRSDAGWGRAREKTYAPACIVSMSPPGYPSAWLRPRIACFRFTWQSHCNSGIHAAC